MPLFQSSKLFKVIDVNTTKNRSPVPVMISSMSVLICNHFYANQANVEEITTLTVTPIWHSRAQASLNVNGRNLDC